MKPAVLVLFHLEGCCFELPVRKRLSAETELFFFGGGEAR